VALQVQLNIRRRGIEQNLHRSNNFISGCNSLLARMVDPLAKVEMLNNNNLLKTIKI
jgi:hypothetical protein